MRSAGLAIADFASASTVLPGATRLSSEKLTGQFPKKRAAPKDDRTTSFRTQTVTILNG